MIGTYSKDTFDIFVSNILIHDKTFNKLFEYIIMLIKVWKMAFYFCCHSDVVFTLNKIPYYIILNQRMVR